MNFAISEDIEEIIELTDNKTDFLNNKNIIISGAFGFLGKYILEYLINIKLKKI